MPAEQEETFCRDCGWEWFHHGEMKEFTREKLNNKVKDGYSVSLRNCERKRPSEASEDPQPKALNAHQPGDLNDPQSEPSKDAQSAPYENPQPEPPKDFLTEPSNDSRGVAVILAFPK